MPNPTSITDVNSATLQELSAASGIAVRTLNANYKDILIHANSSQKRYNIPLSIQAIIDANSPSGLEKVARLRKMTAEAEHKELELDEYKKLLIRKSDAITIISEIISILETNLRRMSKNLPSKLIKSSKEEIAKQLESESDRIIANFWELKENVNSGK